MQNSHLKLIVIIASDTDADKLIKRLVGQGYPATKISSTGGFLRKGNATILSGVEADEVDQIIAIVRQECYARTEYVPVQTLPFFGEGSVLAEPIEVRVGGAIVFVVDVERFERI
ncbi:MAG TPA: cyclic-di-AMP receptor [Dehalococcoidia bacterium]|nr:cyclic-di-AMP receptor [Dehalococcoidia bacterium]